MGHLMDEFGIAALLPAAAGACPECGREHPAGMPHDLTLLYHYSFYDREGRCPSWRDAAAHCDAELRRSWLAELRNMGVDVDFRDEMGLVAVDLRMAGEAVA